LSTWKKIVVSGSDAHLSSVSASVSLGVNSNQRIGITQDLTRLTGSFTGSFVGNGSGLTNLNSDNLILPNSQLLNLANTDKFYVKNSNNAYITYGDLLTELIGSNLAVQTLPGYSSIQVAPVVSNLTSVSSTSFTGSLKGTASTASYVLNAVSASFASTASYWSGTVTSASYSQTSTTASYVLNSVSSSYATTASYALQSLSSSFATTSNTASYVLNAVSSSFASTASYWSGTVTSASYATTASYVLNSVSSSFATTASYINTLGQNITVSGSIFLSGSLNTPVLVDYEERFTSPTISAGGLTLNLANGNVFNVALNAAITTLTISSPPAPNNAGSFVLIFTADGTPRAVSWGASVSWPAGTAPTLTSTNGKKDVFGFISLNTGSNWYGFIGGQNI